MRSEEDRQGDRERLAASTPEVRKAALGGGIDRIAELLELAFPRGSRAKALVLTKLDEAKLWITQLEDIT